jgi:hypothetical protein
MILFIRIALLAGRQEMEVEVAVDPFMSTLPKSWYDFSECFARNPNSKNRTIQNATTRNKLFFDSGAYKITSELKNIAGGVDVAESWERALRSGIMGLWTPPIDWTMEANVSMDVDQ